MTGRGRRSVLSAALVSMAALCGVAAAVDTPAPAKPKARTRPTTRPAARQKAATTQPASGAKKPEAEMSGPSLLPCPATSRPAGKRPQAGRDEIPRFAVDSPFAKPYTRPAQKPEKVLWARSCLWRKAPKLVVEKWLTRRPDTKGKYVLIEFWATWCPPCRDSVSLLNRFHRKYGRDLVVIGISDQPEADVRRLKEPRIEYFSAIDTQARMKNQLEVRGIPHVILLEPSEGVVIWEGFPYLKGYELTEKTIKKIVSIKPRRGK